MSWLDRLSPNERRDLVDGGRIGRGRFEGPDTVNEKIQLTNIERYVENARENARVGRVLIAADWFKVDPYGAAVSGIMKSIHIAIGSGVAGGMSQGEFDILMRVRQALIKEDAALADEYKIKDPFYPIGTEW